VILLDTNVVSEWMKREPEPAVIAWLDRQVASRLFISAVTRAEIETGIGILPEGRRKTTLTAAAAVVLKDFEQRCLAFDCDCAMRYGAIITESRRLGRPISVEDAQIGAIAVRYIWLLYESGYGRNDILALLRFIDWMLRLPPAFEQELRSELIALEEQKKMSYVMSIERMAEERGEARGETRGEARMLTRLLTLKFGPLSPETQQRISEADADTLLTWSERVLTANTIDEILL